MKKLWLSFEECTGCGACKNICPVGAITLDCDRYGFAFPVIHDSCIECNRCSDVCSKRLNVNSEFNNCTPQTYAAWSNDCEVRFCSTSGGVFSEIASFFLKRGGYVIGAQYADDNMVEHVIIDNVDDLIKIRQSKYVQSNTKMVFAEIKELLNKGKLVVFCGTPCQVAAAYAYLEKDYQNFFSIDFICRGVNSPKAYISWIKEIEKKHHSAVTKVWFKYKSLGWNQSPQTVKIDFASKKSIVLSGEDNLFMTSYLKSNILIRPSCGNCNFKGVPRYADITLGDFWGIEKRYDNDKGTSVILINNKKGNELFNRISNRLFVIPKDFDEVVKGNICLFSSINIPPTNSEFIKSLDTFSFSEAIYYYTGIYSDPSAKAMQIKLKLKKFLMRLK